MGDAQNTNRKTGRAPCHQLGAGSLFSTQNLRFFQGQTINWGRVARSFEEHMIFSTFGLVENWVTNKFVGVFLSKGTTCWGKLRYPILDEKPLNHQKNTWFSHQKTLLFSDEAMF